MRNNVLKISNCLWLTISLSLCLVGASLFTSCNQTAGPLASFYFPNEHKIFVYSSNDSIGREYWEVNRTEDTYHTKVYDGSYTLNQETVEQLYSNGINLEQLHMIQSDETISVTIESGFIFPFEEIDSSEVVFYKIKWELSDSNNSTTSYELVRNRRFIGYENRQVLGNSINCAVFKLDERIITDMDGVIELNTTGIEYYAESIGLVYRQRRVTDKLMIEQELLAILSPEEFVDLSGSK